MPTRSSSDQVVRLHREAMLRSGFAPTVDQPLVRNGTREKVSDEEIEVPIAALETMESTTIRVLHVDDETEWIGLTKTFLERANENIGVEGEVTVVAALERLRTEAFDCIVSDYDMPNTDGLEFLDLVRDRHPNLPFVLFTGKGSEKIASEAISAGVTDYVEKRATDDKYDLLANRIENAVDKYRTQQQCWEALSWYRRLVEQDFTGVIIVQHGHFTYVNQRCGELFGYRQDEIVDRPLEDVLADSTDQDLREWLEDDQHSREAMRGTLAIREDDGGTTHFDFHGGSIQYDGQSASIGILWEQ